MDVPPKHGKRIVIVVLLSQMIDFHRLHALVFVVVHVKSKKPLRFRPFPSRYVSMIVRRFGIDTSNVSKCSAIRSSAIVPVDRFGNNYYNKDQ
jgi:hypothetical protein